MRTHFVLLLVMITANGFTFNRSLDYNDSTYVLANDGSRYNRKNIPEEIKDSKMQLRDPRNIPASSKNLTSSSISKSNQLKIMRAAIDYNYPYDYYMFDLKSRHASVPMPTSYSLNIYSRNTSLPTHSTNTSKQNASTPLSTVVIDLNSQSASVSTFSTNVSNQNASVSVKSMMFANNNRNDSLPQYSTITMYENASIQIQSNLKTRSASLPIHSTNTSNQNASMKIQSTDFVNINSQSASLSILATNTNSQNASVTVHYSRSATIPILTTNSSQNASIPESTYLNITSTQTITPKMDTLISINILSTTHSKNIFDYAYDYYDTETKSHNGSIPLHSNSNQSTDIKKRRRSKRSSSMTQFLIDTPIHIQIKSILSSTSFPYISDKDNSNITIGVTTSNSSFVTTRSTYREVTRIEQKYTVSLSLKMDNETSFSILSMNSSITFLGLIPMSPNSTSVPASTFSRLKTISSFPMTAPHFHPKHKHNNSIKSVSSPQTLKHFKYIKISFTPLSFTKTNSSTKTTTSKHLDNDSSTVKNTRINWLGVLPLSDQKTVQLLKVPPDPTLTTKARKRGIRSLWAHIMHPSNDAKNLNLDAFFTTVNCNRQNKESCRHSRKTSDAAKADTNDDYEFLTPYNGNVDTDSKSEKRCGLVVLTRRPRAGTDLVEQAADGEWNAMENEINMNNNYNISITDNNPDSCEAQCPICITRTDDKPTKVEARTRSLSVDEFDWNVIKNLWNDTSTIQRPVRVVVPSFRRKLSAEKAWRWTLVTTKATCNCQCKSKSGHHAKSKIKKSNTNDQYPDPNDTIMDGYWSTYWNTTHFTTDSSTPYYANIGSYDANWLDDLNWAIFKYMTWSIIGTFVKGRDEIDKYVMQTDKFYSGTTAVVVYFSLFHGFPDVIKARQLVVTEKHTNYNPNYDYEYKKHSTRRTTKATPYYKNLGSYDDSWLEDLNFAIEKYSTWSLVGTFVKARAHYEITYTKKGYYGTTKVLVYFARNVQKFHDEIIAFQSVVTEELPNDEVTDQITFVTRRKTTKGYWKTTGEFRAYEPKVSSTPFYANFGAYGHQWLSKLYWVMEENATWSMVGTYVKERDSMTHTKVGYTGFTAVVVYFSRFSNTNKVIIYASQSVITKKYHDEIETVFHYAKHETRDPNMPNYNNFGAYDNKWVNSLFRKVQQYTVWSMIGRFISLRDGASVTYTKFGYSGTTVVVVYFSHLVDNFYDDIRASQSVITDPYSAATFKKKPENFQFRARPTPAKATEVSYRDDYYENLGGYRNEWLHELFSRIRKFRTWSNIGIFINERDITSPGFTHTRKGYRGTTEVIVYFARQSNAYILKITASQSVITETEAINRYDYYENFGTYNECWLNDLVSKINQQGVWSKLGTFIPDRDITPKGFTHTRDRYRGTTVVVVYFERKSNARSLKITASQLVKTNQIGNVEYTTTTINEDMIITDIVFNTEDCYTYNVATFFTNYGSGRNPLWKIGTHIYNCSKTPMRSIPVQGTKQVPITRGYPPTHTTLVYASTVIVRKESETPTPVKYIYVNFGSYDYNWIEHLKWKMKKERFWSQTGVFVRARDDVAITHTYKGYIGTTVVIVYFSLDSNAITASQTVVTDKTPFFYDNINNYKANFLLSLMSNLKIYSTWTIIGKHNPARDAPGITYTPAGYTGTTKVVVIFKLVRVLLRRRAMKMKRDIRDLNGRQLDNAALKLQLVHLENRKQSSDVELLSRRRIMEKRRQLHLQKTRLKLREKLGSKPGQLSKREALETRIHYEEAGTPNMMTSGESQIHIIDLESQTFDDIKTSRRLNLGTRSRLRILEPVTTVDVPRSIQPRGINIFDQPIHGLLSNRLSSLLTPRRNEIPNPIVPSEDLEQFEEIEEPDTLRQTEYVETVAPEAFRLESPTEERMVKIDNIKPKRMLERQAMQNRGNQYIRMQRTRLKNNVRKDNNEIEIQDVDYNSMFYTLEEVDDGRTYNGEDMSVIEGVRIIALENIFTTMFSDDYLPYTLAVIASLIVLSCLICLCIKLYKKSKYPRKWETVGCLKEIYLYPVKSLPPLVPPEIKVSMLGLEYGWIYNGCLMVIDEERKVISAKVHWTLYKVQTTLSEDALVLKHHSTGTLVLRIDEILQENKMLLYINGKPIYVWDCGEKSRHWITTVVNSPLECNGQMSKYRLVYKPRNPTKKKIKNMKMAMKSKMKIPHQIYSCFTVAAAIIDEKKVPSRSSRDRTSKHSVKEERPHSKSRDRAARRAAKHEAMPLCKSCEDDELIVKILSVPKNSNRKEYCRALFNFRPHLVISKCWNFECEGSFIKIKNHLFKNVRIGQVNNTSELTVIKCTKQPIMRRDTVFVGSVPAGNEGYQTCEPCVVRPVLKETCQSANSTPRSGEFCPSVTLARDVDLSPSRSRSSPTRCGTPPRCGRKDPCQSRGSRVTIVEPDKSTTSLYRAFFPDRCQSEDCSLYNAFFRTPNPSQSMENFPVPDIPTSVSGYGQFFVKFNE